MAESSAEEIQHAYFEGRTASESDAAAWRSRLDIDPEDMVARAAWIGWAMPRHRIGEPPTAELHGELIWLVRNRPGLEFVGSVVHFCGHPRAWIDIEPLRTAWLEAVRIHGDDPEVLDHAASYFAFQDREQERTLLERARDLEPEKPIRELRLSHHWFLQAKSRLVAEPRSGERALASAERAVELEGAEAPSDSCRVHRLRCAEVADRWDLAERYATELANWAEQEPTRVGIGDAHYHSHRILGHVALRRGDVEAAKAHLLRCCSGGSSPVLGSFGPDFSLAQELLERGERETVLQFLEQCRTIWTHHTSTVDRLVKQVQSGQPCNLSRR